MICVCVTLSVQVYLAQTIFKLLMVTLILGYSTPLLDSVSFHHTCYPEEHALLGYATFECTHALASLLHKLLVAYLTLVGLYGLLDVYTLSWILHRLEPTVCPFTALVPKLVRSRTRREFSEKYYYCFIYGISFKSKKG